MIKKFVSVSANDKHKHELIKAFYDSYYNTDQDVETFAVEFFDVVGAILSGKIPVELDHLTDHLDSMVKICTELIKKTKEERNQNNKEE